MIKGIEGIGSGIRGLGPRLARRCSVAGSGLARLCSVAGSGSLCFIF